MTMHGPIFGEFLGTLILIVLGEGNVANVLLTKSKAEHAGWLTIATAWGIAVLFGIITSLAVGGVAHLNPAITLALAVANGSYDILLPYIAAQMAGAFTGAVLVWLIFLPHWRETKDPALKLAVFCTAPAIRALPANALTEFLVTILLVVVGFSISSKGVAPDGLAAGAGPTLWGMLVWGIGLSLGGPTGYAINPARDLAPRLAHALLPIAGKGASDWGYATIPVIAPLLGGVAGALICKMLGIV
jgi:glycerol uptake facilitator protein